MLKYISLYILILIIVGCATPTVEELDRQAMACMKSFVQDESGEIRQRNKEEIDRDCGELFDKRNKLVERNRQREIWANTKITCPPGKIIKCDGFSCGKPMRRKMDRYDYTCMDRR